MNSEKDLLYLAALLHDIGKFSQRADKSIAIKDESTYCPLYKGRYTHKHVLWTADFVDTYASKFKDFDADNRLCITDRKKDMIVMSGWKIYPTEVEDALLRFEGISEIAVFGVPHEHRGEIPVAAVVWKEGYSAENEADLIEFAKQHLAGYKVPRKVITIGALPRVNGWKLLRRELREKYA